MDHVARFAAEAESFERWLVGARDLEAAAAKECLIRLLELYRAGIALPPASSEKLESSAVPPRVDDAEWRKAYESASRLPLDAYSEVFDPTTVPADAPVIGSLSDDLADIYRDVVTGLRAYKRGERDAALWEWTFNLRSHWGAHATGAIRALHWWLSNRDPRRLSNDGVD